MRRRVACVGVTYLRSYARMGMARLSCDGACGCAPATFDAHTDRNTSLSFTGVPVILNATGGASSATFCMLRLRVLESTRSGAHKFKLMALTVVPPSLSARRGGALGQKRVATWQSEMLSHATDVSAVANDGSR